MTPQEQLTAKIREALPHLMELKENCIIKNKNNCHYMVINFQKSHLNLVRLEDNILIGVSLPLSDFYTIIGAEPTLNDVLMYVLEKDAVIDNNNTKNIYIIDKYNNYAFYNLQLPYSQQSDEWFNFMLGL